MTFKVSVNSIRSIKLAVDVLQVIISEDLITYLEISSLSVYSPLAQSSMEQSIMSFGNASKTYSGCFIRKLKFNYKI